MCFISGYYIAPRKAKNVESDKIKKGITKQIGVGIEQAIHQEALSKGNEFKLLANTPSQSTAGKSTSN